jgi:hypothetical protein
VLGAGRHRDDHSGAKHTVPDSAQCISHEFSSGERIF